MPGEPPQIGKQALFARLAEGHAAGITVVTPNNRLAKALRAEFDAFQVNKNLQVWEDADILPLDAFVERRYEDSLYADPRAGAPQLLSAAQAQAVWEKVLEKSGLLAIPETAARCVDAWQLAHRWRIDGAIGKFESSEDAKAFAQWARDYSRRCEKEGWIDAARLPELKLAAKEPKLLVACGFNLIPPQSREFLGGFTLVLCTPDEKKSNAGKTQYPSARHEIEAAAKWARGRLEQGAKRIGVVVPDLGRRRREVVRTFAQVLGTRRAFDVSLGEPLAAFPIAALPLSLLQLVFKDLSFEETSRLIRSPFLGGSGEDMAARARLDVKLRRRLGAQVSLPKLIAGAEGSFRVCLEKIFRIGKENESKTQSAFAWAQVFTSILEAAGFPGERALDSAEFQARAKLNEMLSELGRLNFVFEKISGVKAIQELETLCSTLFQPESPEAPIQVLGVLESLGLEFDALWISGMTEQAWPLRVSPNPFLPVQLQKKAGIPEASAERSLERAKEITADWSGAAAEVVFSWPQREQDRDLLPSPLIADIPGAEIRIPPFRSYQDLLFQNRKTEKLHDEKAPPVKEQAVRGGTRVLADQAACPFRAFARWRLGAEPMESPAAGPDDADRGLLLHALMAGIWEQVKDRAGLEKELSTIVYNSAKAAVGKLGIEGRFAELEVERLSKLAREWLQIEARRDAFQVVEIEKKIPIQLAGLSLEGRLDRMDRLADGSHVLIDYKSGEASVKSWMGERPDEPQLPIYALSSGREISAAAFARLKTGKMGFAGLADRKNLLPDVKEAEDWQQLLKDWKTETDRLASQFVAGDARVDPKKPPATCRNCALHPLCRVHERLSLLAEADGEGA